MIIKKVNINDIKPNSKNPRLIKDDAFKKLVKSIKEAGWMLGLRPIVVDEDGVILGGNMRYKAAKDAGLKEVEVIYANELSAEQKKEFIIKDNVGFGEWDIDALLADFDVEDLSEWGLDLPELTICEDEEVVEDDFDVNEGVKTDIVIGDLIEIGEHRLVCGDSTNIDDVDKLMRGVKATMLFTDPPYLMNFEGGNTDGGKKSFSGSHGAIKNDKMSEEYSLDFLDAINATIILFVKGAFYICFYRFKLDEYFQSLKRAGLQVRALITWDKGNHTLSHSDYMSRCEHIFYGWVDKHIFHGGKNGVDVWNIPRTKKNDLHPTMKPIELCAKAITDASKTGDIVLDLFLGSGSTMVAAHQLKRKCYGMELEPKYCQVIIDRMLALDKTLEIKINGNLTKM
jgi:DNA modification methylase